MTKMSINWDSYFADFVEKPKPNLSLSDMLNRVCTMQMCPPWSPKDWSTCACTPLEENNPKRYVRNPPRTDCIMTADMMYIGATCDAGYIDMVTRTNITKRKYDAIVRQWDIKHPPSIYSSARDAYSATRVTITDPVITEDPISDFTNIKSVKITPVQETKIPMSNKKKAGIVASILALAIYTQQD